MLYFLSSLYSELGACSFLGCILGQLLGRHVRRHTFDHRHLLLIDAAAVIVVSTVVDILLQYVFPPPCGKSKQETVRPLLL